MSNNPFSLTKANDLTDAQINSLWVDVNSEGEPGALFHAGRFTSPMPTFILGGKGSGKTHLMRYASFPLQSLRFGVEAISLTDGLRRDGYIGIYVKCSGLDGGRFQGKGQSFEAWSEVFSFYLELWLGQSLLEIAAQIMEAGRSSDELALCNGVDDLFDQDPPNQKSLQELCRELINRRKRLDYEVNNAAFTGILSPRIAVTRGRLIFGLPKLIAALIPQLSDIQFCYQLDEFENLTEPQQVHVNTLVRERESPATFKIGARQFGIRTHRTLSADEVNLRDSEFDEVRLDKRFRQNKPQYRQLAELLVERRLETFRVDAPGKATITNLRDWFDEPDLDWNSVLLEANFAQIPSKDRKHFRRLQDVLRAGFKLSAAPGLDGDSAIERIVEGLAAPKHPVLEKLNILILYGEWARDRNLVDAAAKIHRQCATFLTKRAQDGPYADKLKRYKSDLVAQLLRENGQKQIYAGLQNFIRMSEGQPRALITLLKQTYDWALFQGERPFVEGKISHGAQSRGAASSAEWFYNSIMKAGEDGKAILIAIDRLSQLFRINRYSDNVRECSLIGFSASLISVSERAVAVLEHAADRSFLVEVDGGQQERNSEQVTRKFQLNRMLVPRWALGTARRGIAPFGRQEIEAVFDPEKEDEFLSLRRAWEARASAPLFGKQRGRSADANDDGDADDSGGQTDLFDR